MSHEIQLLLMFLAGIPLGCLAMYWGIDQFEEMWHGKKDEIKYAHISYGWYEEDGKMKCGVIPKGEHGD